MRANSRMVVGAFIILIIVGNAHAASFDCGKATSEVEKLVCGNEELSKLDESLNKSYLKALDRSDIRKHMIETQRQWLRNERNACKSAECLKKSYETRIKELGLSSYGTVIESPSKPAASSSTSPPNTSESQPTEPAGKVIETEPGQQHESRANPDASPPDGHAPKELKRLLSAGEELYDFRKADLNGDGLMDYVFVVAKPENNGSCSEDRVLKIAVRSSDGRLRVVKSNHKIMLCKEAGGAFGDPYTGIETGDKWFSVSHTHGSAARSTHVYTFAYSRKDKTWQLVLAREVYSDLDPDTSEVVIKENHLKPPKDFGKIDIADFDPENY